MRAVALHVANRLVRRSRTAGEIAHVVFVDREMVECLMLAFYSGIEHRHNHTLARLFQVWCGGAHASTPQLMLAGRAALPPVLEKGSKRSIGMSGLPAAIVSGCLSASSILASSIFRVNTKSLGELPEPADSIFGSTPTDSIDSPLPVLGVLVLLRIMIVRIEWLTGYGKVELALGGWRGLLPLLRWPRSVQCHPCPPVQCQ